MNRQGRPAEPPHRRADPVSILTCGLAVLLACQHGGLVTASPASLYAEVVSHLGPLRPVEGRLEGIAYAPYRGWGIVPRHQLGTAEAAQLARRAVPHSPDHLAARALLRLAAVDLDGAARLFAAAAAHDPEPARWWSDLAAVRLRLAERDHRPHELLLALAAAEKAWRADHALRAAAFNRALALERLYLRRAALGAWQDFLAHEQDPSWRSEAETHTRLARSSLAGERWLRDRPELERAAADGDGAAVCRTVSRYPQEAREAAEGDLLARWARERRAGHPETAGRSLAAVKRIGEALADSGGDTMARDAAAVINAAESASSPLRLLHLIEGHLRYAEGLDLYRDGAFDQAALALTRAHASLSAARSPFAAWAEFQLARCAYQHADYPRARGMLAALLRRVRPSHPALRGNALNLLGLVQLLTNEITASLGSYTAAGTIFAHLRETGNRSLAESSLATDLDLLGEQEALWQHLASALAAAVESTAPTVVYLAFERAALSVLHFDDTNLAVYFEDEVVDAARRSARPLVIAEALRWRATLREVVGDRQHALGDLRNAELQLGKLRDEYTFRIVAGDIMRVRGELERAAEPRRALAALNQAIALYRLTHYHYFLAKVLLDRGLLLRDLGLHDQAERDLEEAIAEREGQRSQISDAWSRVHYFDDLHEIFEAMARFQVETRKRPDLAFEYVERGRARLVLDLLGSTGARDAAGAGLSAAAQPLTVRQLLGRLPAHTAVIEFLPLDDRLYCWVMRAPDVFTFHETGFDRRILAGLIERFNQALARHRSAADLGTALYELLLAPLSSDLPVGWDLVIVPGGALHRIPFAALRVRESGRFLVETHAIAVASSASVWFAGRRRDERLRHLGWRRALAINDPTIDRRRHPELPQLRSAGAALDRWIARHPGSRLLAHERATRMAFLRLAGDYQIVHFNGHALVNSEAPQLSRLLLAWVPERSDDGELLAADLLGRRFPRTRLVILAGCGTATGPASAGEGSLSLSMPFLAAGVPAVIGSLWNVDDQETERLFAAFYRRLDRGASPMTALQGAETELLHEEGSARGSPAGVWAAFELSGSAS